MEQMLTVSSNPHVRARMTTAKIMQLVAIALLPAAIVGIYNFGFKALAILVVSTGSAVLAEWLYDHFMHKPNTIGDFSAVVTGLLIGMNMPAGIPLWIPALGSIFAISFAGKMTDFSVSDSFKGAVDGVTGATPLAALRDHGFVAGSSVPIKNLLIGNIQGTIGETSVIAILIGAAILLCYKVISARIPLTYIGSFAVFVIIYMLASGKGFDVNYLFTHLFGGGLMLGAWFMATDYVTSPITVKGQYVYGVCLGVLTGIFRIFGASAEGVSYAIIFCNLLVPQIERFTRPVAFGKGGAKK